MINRFNKYVIYKFSEKTGKVWFQYLDNLNVLHFTKHQTNAAHFNTREAAQVCIDDLKKSMRINLTIEEAHV